MIGPANMTLASQVPNLSTMTVLGNLYYDFANDICLHTLCWCRRRLWLGADTASTGDDSGFAVGLAAGVAVDLTKILHSMWAIASATP